MLSIFVNLNFIRKHLETYYFFKSDLINLFLFKLIFIKKLYKIINHYLILNKLIFQIGKFSLNNVYSIKL